jgi:crotonobetainyl-CoA:carnitine CoA-transferase CaiB-like acyl-CoA transferase
MPAGVFRCTDGELMLVVGNDGQFTRTCVVLGSPQLATDPRFLKNNDRVVHGKEIMAIFAGLFLKKPVAYWLDELEKAGVPSGPINDFSQVFADPHSARAACRSVDHPFSRTVADPQCHHVLGTPVKDYRAPPLLGADTRMCWRRSATTTRAGSAEGAEDHLSDIDTSMNRNMLASVELGCTLDRSVRGVQR